MSFWNGLKRTLGFSGNEDEEDEEYDASVPTYAVEHTSPAPDREPEEAQPTESIRPVSAKPEKASSPQPAADLPGDIFDAVIELFNATMPEFVSSSLSVDSQRRYIYEHISKSVRARLENLGQEPTATAPFDASWKEERDKLVHTIETLRIDNENTERLREEVNKLRLSADRQKRALNDRIKDLDNQLAKLRQEKERILTSRKGDPITDPAQLEERDKTIAQLKADIEALNITVGNLKAEVEKERTLKEQLEVKASMSDAMINSLQSQAAKAKEDLEKANEELAVAVSIQEQLERFEDIKRKKDAKIADLQEQIKRLNENAKEMSRNMEGDAGTVDTLRTENASLRRTIETNLYNQANAELKLRNEIKQLRRELDEANEKISAAEAQPTLIDEPAAPPVKKRRGRPRKNRQAIDENLDNTDWLESSGGKYDPDFGYHEPPRRIVPENDAQLSLF